MITGTFPSRRARRASFFPRPSRGKARTIISFFSAIIALLIIPSPFGEGLGEGFTTACQLRPSPQPSPYGKREKTNQRFVQRFKLSFLKAEVLDGYLAFSVCPLFS